MVASSLRRGKKALPRRRADERASSAAKLATGIGYCHRKHGGDVKQLEMPSRRRFHFAATERVIALPV
jgi:hypothetical protein